MGRSVEKTVPKTRQACTRTDSTVEDLYFWSDGVENWGGVVVALMIVTGIVMTIVGAISVDEEAIFSTVLSSVVSWGLGAFFAYCGYRLLALLLRALATITQHTIITANVALYESSKAADEKEIIIGKEGNWVCPDCKNKVPYDIIRCKCGYEK